MFVRQGTAFIPQPPRPRVKEGEPERVSARSTSEPKATICNPRPLLHRQARRGGKGTGAQRQDEGRSAPG